ncbi:MAG: DUF2066 domain-containing protein [Rhodospirillaceae bacterium]|jgi:hypothetical protein|nr:DUF2066 domain-containing protein [Rhodospirillaceae bacterium]MBT5244190.1 DUF2066 domain-containing protein [Rhodospirillaceae bacterium]MBT5561715.1 DUF2066 domain-containing protein [Rhodospirillaceae bacterium]MBT6243154.1 DUF2066 domain-containing protein [Rhodospirillaceae bacterium]MBT7137453.1 DUF2066 domain-containing protein [Rhodospirillaceae bacterium]
MKINVLELFAMIDPWLAKSIRTFVLFVGLLCALVGTGQAAQNDVFVTSGLKVDVTAASTAEARDKALAMGERAAFRQLLERLTMRRDHFRLPAFSAAEIAAFVLDFEVAQEKASAVRYLATLNYSFKADAVRRMLIDREIAFAETTSKPVLVLPVYQAAGALLLWDDPNPWRHAWAERPEIFSLVPAILPGGDLSDIATIGPEQAVSGDEQRLSAIAGRYDAGDTIVAHATMNMDRGRPDLEVYVTRYGTAQQEQTVVKSFTSGEQETLDMMLTRAAVELTRQIEDNWKRDNLLQFGQQAVVAVKIRIGGLADWLDIRNRLGGVAVIRKSDLVLLSLDEVRVNLHYIGEPGQLALALEQADLVINREGDGWVLELGK